MTVSKASSAKLRITLVSGNLYFDVKKPLPASGSLEFKAGGTVMGVRGTDGVFSHVKGQVTSIIFSGNITLTVVPPTGGTGGGGGGGNNNPPQTPSGISLTLNKFTFITFQENPNIAAGGGKITVNAGGVYKPDKVIFGDEQSYLEGTIFKIDSGSAFIGAMPAGIYDPGMLGFGMSTPNWIYIDGNVTLESHDIESVFSYIVVNSGKLTANVNMNILTFFTSPIEVRGTFEIPSGMVLNIGSKSPISVANGATFINKGTVVPQDFARIKVAQGGTVTGEALTFTAGINGTVVEITGAGIVPEADVSYVVQFTKTGGMGEDGKSMTFTVYNGSPLLTENGITDDTYMYDDWTLSGADTVKVWKVTNMSTTGFTITPFGDGQLILL